MPKVNDFLNPTSMITPGIAGGITMVVTNTLWMQFALPQKWTALVLSFLLGTLVFIQGSCPLWQRLIYYVLNSLIIFSVGIGTNTVGAQIALNPSMVQHIRVANLTSPASAFAETKTDTAANAGDKKSNASKNKSPDSNAQSTMNEKNPDKSAVITKSTQSCENAKERKFFQAW